MRRSSPIVLLTDFGTRDHYAATMKGVLMSLAPRSPVVDLSHGVGAYDVDGAAYLLWSSYRYFPRNTVFAAVIDPGVGTSRRIACLRTPSYTFLAPDNGVLKFIAGESPGAAAYAVRMPRRTVSSTFHGRDIFAPVAARLARGLRPSSLGPKIRLQGESMVDARRMRGGRIEGRVLAIDRFGNIVTNVLAPPDPAGIAVTLGRRRVKRSSATYAGGGAGAAFLIRGSAGLLEISMNRRSAARALRVRSGQKVIVCKV